MGENKSESEVKGKRYFNNNICRWCTYHLTHVDDVIITMTIIIIIIIVIIIIYMCCLLPTPSEYNELYELIWN